MRFFTPLLLATIGIVTSAVPTYSFAQTAVRFSLSSAVTQNDIQLVIQGVHSAWRDLH